jgi:hypothetical protein
MVFDGRRPAFAREFDEALGAPGAGRQTARRARPLGYPARERMIQDAMALRSLGELVRDLDEVLAGAAYWAADCDIGLWRDLVPEPGLPGRTRPLADLLAGWGSPLSHVEWHLDRLVGDGPVEDGAEAAEEPDERLVRRCPLHP